MAKMDLVESGRGEWRRRQALRIHARRTQALPKRRHPHAKQMTLPVVGMMCANCVRTVERNSKKVEGVSDATVNYASEKVTVVFDPSSERSADRRQSGHRAHPACRL